MRRMAVRPLHLNGTLARSSAAVFAVNGMGRITLWNHAAERLFEHPAREAIGQPSCDVVRPYAGLPTLCYRGCHAGLVSLESPMQSVNLRTRTRAGRPICVTVSALVIAGPKDRGPTVMHLLREGARADAQAPSGDAGLPAAPPATAALTRRETDVLRLMDSGLDTRAIADTLGVSGATVRNHAQTILGKLGVHSRLAAVAAAHRRAIL
jgi:DNA-binding CsgD family transcriptional regulator